MRRIDIERDLRYLAEKGPEGLLPATIKTLAKEAADALESDDKSRYELLNLRKKVAAQREEIKRLMNLGRTKTHEHGNHQAR